MPMIFHIASPQPLHVYGKGQLSPGIRLYPFAVGVFFDDPRNIGLSVVKGEKIPFIDVRSYVVVFG